MQKILYQDDHVRIDRDEITIIQYFFPIPMDKTIKMKDIQCVGLKYDIDNDKKYIEIIVKGFSSLNATFCPEDPNKVMAIVQTYSSLARSNLYANLKSKDKEQVLTQAKVQVTQPTRQDIDKKQQDIRSIQPTAEDARKQNLQYQNPSVISSVTHTIAHGWDVVKQSAHNIYEATTDKIHEYTSGHQVQKKTQQAKQDIKEGAQDIKEGTKEVSEELGEKAQEGKEKVKQTYQNVKQKANQTWENVKEGAEEMVSEDAKNKAQSANEKFKQGAQDAADSVKKATGYEYSYLPQAKQNIALGSYNFKKAPLSGQENISKKLQGISLQEKNKPYVYKTDQSLKEKSFNITG